MMTLAFGTSACRTGARKPLMAAEIAGLGPRGLEHAEVVVEVAPAVEQALHRNGPRQVIPQHRARHGAVEAVGARPPAQDEVYDRLRLLRRGWEMPLAVLDEDRDPPAEFPVAPL